MPNEAIELLKSINKHLEELTHKEDTPRLTSTKELSEKYPINRGTAIQFCKKYGIKFGGYCIEADKLKEILQTQGITILKEWKTMKKKRKLRIVNKTKFIEATSMTILLIVTTAMFIHKIYSCGILWFFTTLR